MSGGPVRYARNGDVRLAYRVFGESGPTLVWVPGWVVANVDNVDEPGNPYARLIERGSQATQVVMWDRRGTGLSDPMVRVPTLDERLDDLRAVIDAVGADRPAVLGSSEGGLVSLLYAASYPERVRALVIYAAAARFSQSPPDFPWGFTTTEIESQLAEIDRAWGEGALVNLFHGESAAVPGVREMFGKLQRSMASPAMAKLWWQAFMDIDVRGILSAIRAPTLVLSRPGDALVQVEAAAALAADIPNAQFIPLPAGAHNAFDIIDITMDHALRFLLQEPTTPVEERVLKTVVFTDIVDSTQTLSAQGDAQWRSQLDSHDRLVDHMISKYDGVRANHTGDGVFVLFDAPTKSARCALELVPALAGRNIPVRIGIHTGECERRGQEWSGLAVHIGARIAGMAGAGEVLVSRTVRDLSAGSGLVFESLGPQQLKGLPEAVDVYRVTAG